MARSHWPCTGNLSTDPLFANASSGVSVAEALVKALGEMEGLLESQQRPFVAKVSRNGTVALLAIGNSLGIVIEKSFLDLLDIDRDTELEMRS